MKIFPSSDEVGSMLKSVGLTLSPWGAVVPATTAEHTKRHLYQYLPSDLSPRELMVLSHFAGGWLSANRSCLLQLDNSSGTLGSLELGYLGLPADTQRACQYLRSDRDVTGTSMWLDICRLVHAVLLFELHGHFSVCPLSSDVLSVQDGCLYFFSASEKRIKDAESLIDCFLNAPDVLPEWVAEPDPEFLQSEEKGEKGSK